MIDPKANGLTLAKLRELRHLHSKYAVPMPGDGPWEMTIMDQTVFVASPTHGVWWLDELTLKFVKVEWKED